LWLWWLSRPARAPPCAGGPSNKDKEAQVRYERKKVAELKPHPENPRRGDVEAIAESLSAHGQYRPITVQKSTGFVLAGNHTLAAAASLGWDEVAVVVVDVDDEQARRILLVDNRTADMGSYDDDALVSLLQSLEDLGGTGYTFEDIPSLDMAEVEAKALAEFPSFDEDISVAYRCPSCAYEWSGSPRPEGGGLAEA